MDPGKISFTCHFNWQVKKEYSIIRANGFETRMKQPEDKLTAK
jgi:hypothetical protein